MEDPPGSLGDLQPQDLSTSGLPPAGMDLTQATDQRVFTPAPVDTLRLVRSPGWYSNVGAGSHALQFAGTSSTNVPGEAADQIQPDDTFSQTTVTLSYVSRSHVFSNPASISPSALYSVPPLSKMSYRPACDSNRSLRRPSWCVTNQDGPLDLATQTQVLQPPADKQHELNGDLEKSLLEEEDNCGGRNQGMDNRQENRLSSSDSSPELLSTVLEEDTCFLLSYKQKPAAMLEGVDTAEQPSSQDRSPVVQPDPPQSTFVGILLPVTSRTQRAEGSPPEPLLCDGPSAVVRDGTATPQDTRDASRSTEGQETPLKPLEGLTSTLCPSKLSENKRPTVVHLNGNVNVPGTTFLKQNLAARHGHGTRLSSLLRNVSSSNCGASRSIRPKGKLPHTSVGACPAVRSRGGASPVRGKRTPTGAPRCERSSSDSISTSDSERSKTLSFSPSPGGGPCRAEQSPKRGCEDDSPSVPHSNPRRSPRTALTCPPSRTPPSSPHPQAKPLVDRHMGRASPSTPLKKTSSGVKSSPKASKRRKTKPRLSCSSSMFSLREPEIKLKYVHYKEEKRFSRSNSFSPFVHMEPQPSSLPLCTVINDPEEVKTQKPRLLQTLATGFSPAATPSSSCLQLGRLSTRSKHRRSLLCCLCGCSANARNLGDLHGPYYPGGVQPSRTSAATAAPNLQGELQEDSDSCSSFSSSRTSRRTCSIAPSSLAIRQGAKLRKHPLGGCSPSAKRARSDGAVDPEDWSSPPVLPLDPREYWLHEDCAVWAAGVFLVKGRVYGLEEAAALAQRTVCSSCHRPGATLGCFFKGCSQKFHYSCALDSDCVLSEENFSMKCRKHKNKTFKGSR